MEHGLSVEAFLGETCRKAGLAREAWRLGETRIEGFTCDVFEEGSEVIDLALSARGLQQIPHAPLRGGSE